MLWGGLKGNTIKEVRAWFYDALKGHSYAEEAESLFWWTAEHVLKQEWSGLKTRLDLQFSESELLDVKHTVERLLQSEPVQYIFETAYFYELDLKVTPAVLIPRPETEELVHLILKRERDGAKGIDIGTGSGCIPLALQQNGMHMEGVDISAEALEIAQYNARKLDLNVGFHQKDMFQEKAFQGMGPFDFVVSNPPYVLESDKNQMAQNVLEYEPELALFVPDEDPLRCYIQLVNLSEKLVKPGGHMYLEIHENQGAATKKLLEASGFENVELHKDLQGKDRMCSARKC